MARLRAILAGCCANSCWQWRGRAKTPSKRDRAGRFIQAWRRRPRNRKAARQRYIRPRNPGRCRPNTGSLESRSECADVCRGAQRFLGSRASARSGGQRPGPVALRAVDFFAGRSDGFSASAFAAFASQGAGIEHRRRDGPPRRGQGGQGFAASFAGRKCPRASRRRQTIKPGCAI